MKTCQCGAEFDARSVFIGGKEVFSQKLCPACIDAKNADADAEQKQKAFAAKTESWNRICPPLYQLTNPEHPAINQKALCAALQWQNNMDGAGVCFIGPSGLCKTRIMLLLAKRLHFEGVGVFFISSTRLAWAFQNQFGADQRNGEARDSIASAHKIPVLFLDDVGKEKFTETVERDFYDLIEQRTSHLRPTHWTANANGAQLEAMMSSDRGGAIMRRLREFSEPIKL